MITSTAAFIVTCVCSIQQAPPPATAPSVNAAFPRPSIYLPQQIMVYDVDRWSTWLNLAAPQALFFKNAWQEYETRWKDDVKRFGPEVERLQILVGELSMGEMHGAFADAIADLRALERKATETLLANDAQLFDQLNAYLAASQQPALAHVVAARNRHVGFAQPFSICPASIEIHKVVQQSNISAESAGVLTECLHEYDLAIAPLLIRLRDSRWQQSGRLSAIDGEIAQSSRRHETVRVAELLEERTRILRQHAQMERRIAMVNLDFSERVQALLQLPFRDYFRARFDAKAYPRIYPDRTDPSRLLRDLVTAAAFDGERLATARSILETHAGQVATVNKQLCVLEDEAEDTFAANMMGTGREGIDTKSARLHGRRRELHRAAIEQTRAILPPTVVSANERRIASALRVLAETPIE